MKSYRKGKRFRFKNGNLIAPNTYYKRAIQYWAKDSFETHKQLKEAQREIKQLKNELNELKEKQ